MTTTAVTMRQGCFANCIKSKERNETEKIMTALPSRIASANVPNRMVLSPAAKLMKKEGANGKQASRKIGVNPRRSIQRKNRRVLGKRRCSQMPGRLPISRAIQNTENEPRITPIQE